MKKDIIAVGVLVHSTKGFDSRDLELVAELTKELEMRQFALFSTQDAYVHAKRQIINGAIRESYCTYRSKIMELSQKICSYEITPDADGDYYIEDNLYLRITPGYSLNGERIQQMLHTPINIYV